MSKDKTIKENIIEYIYIISKQPILLRDLLIANRQYNEGMLVDPAKLGFRLKLTRAYLVYMGIVLGILIPVSGLTHKPLADIDSHISIVGAVVITAIIFIVSIVTIFYKISAHSAGAWGIVGFLIGLYFKYPDNHLYYPILAAIVMAGIINSSRMYLNEHNLNEIFWGSFLGIVVSFGSIYLLT